MLPFGELPGPQLDLVAGYLDVRPLLQRIEQLPIAQGLAGGAPQSLRSSGQGLDLGLQPGGKHLIDPAVNPLVQPLPRRVQPERGHRPFFPGTRSLLLLGGEGNPCLDEYLDAADHTPHIGGRQSGRQWGVDLRQPGMQRLLSRFADELFETSTQSPVGSGSSEDAPQQSPQVESCSTHEQRHPATPQDLPGHLGGRRDVFGQAELDVRFEQVQQMVRNAGSIGG